MFLVFKSCDSLGGKYTGGPIIRHRADTLEEAKAYVHRNGGEIYNTATGEAHAKSDTGWESLGDTTETYAQHVY
jgi:hypothetical protein